MTPYGGLAISTLKVAYKREEGTTFLLFFFFCISFLMRKKAITFN
jgi:hypothetical protein